MTSIVKSFDRELFCEMNMEGKPCIYRKSTRVETYDLGDGNVLLNVRPSSHYIFALTHNWRPQGEVVEWGALPILKKLREIDSWNRDIAEEIIQKEEKWKESQDRSRKNHMESFMYELKDHVKEETKDVIIPGHILKDSIKKTKDKEL